MVRAAEGQLHLLPQFAAEMTSLGLCWAAPAR
jgi:hypothetical protein